jgi:hypothetical protein
LPGSSSMAFLGDIKFQTIFIFGFLIVVLYAKDKFNMPTYDREAMGPFASLPPQSLTIDTRFRRGRTIYLLLMLCLYTAICLVGPITFGDPNISAALGQAAAAAGQFGTQIQLGPAFPVKDPNIWPVVAAAFLVGTGAASDSSLLGRIELFIRRYAHKTAYIPSVVSDLAYSLRTLNLSQWFIENQYVSKRELQDREKALIRLMGADVVAALKASPEEGELPAWGRANVLFYTLDQIFNRSQSSASARLESLTEMSENREIFERLKSDREALDGHFRPHGEQADSSNNAFGQVQRFSRDVSLMIAVLLTRAARNAPYLENQLNLLGFEGVDLRDRSDHFVFTSLVNLGVAATAVAALVLSALLWLYLVQGYEPVPWKVYSYEVLSLIVIQLILYVGTFRVVDYLRDKYLEEFEWHEDLSGYVILLLTCTPTATLICFILITLIFSIIGVTLWFGVLGLIYQFVFQFCLSGLATAFAVYHFRQAARTPRWRSSLLYSMFTVSAGLHAVLMAGLTAAMTMLSAVSTSEAVPQRTFDTVFSLFQTSFANLGNAESIRPIAEKFSQVGNLVKGENPNFTVLKTEVAGLCTLLNSFSNTELKPPTNLFQPGTCTPSKVAADLNNPLEQALVSLAFSIQSFYETLRPFEPKLRHWLFPSLVGFVMALGFGIGLRHARIWWLYNEADQEGGHVHKLELEVKQVYGEEVDFDKFLISPIRSLNFVTPIEAVRYEDYRIKLFSKVRRKQLDIEPFRAHRPGDRAADVTTGPTDSTAPALAG